MPEFTSKPKQKVQHSTRFKHSWKHIVAESGSSTYQSPVPQNSIFFESEEAHMKQSNLGSPSLQSEYRANYTLTNAVSPVFRYKTSSAKSTGKSAEEVVEGSLTLAESDSASTSSSSEDAVILCPKMSPPRTCVQPTAATSTNKQTKGNVGHKKSSNKKLLIHKEIAKNSVVPIFIGDLDQKIDEKFLLAHFQCFKSIESVRICKNPKSSTALNYAYINFKDHVEAAELLNQFNYKPIMGKDVRMMYSFRDKSQRQQMGTNVFFSELPLENENLTTRAFYEKLLSFGSILSCKLDKRKGIGFVYFANKTAAIAAIDHYNNNLFFGQHIKCGIHFEKSVRNQCDFDEILKSSSENKVFKEDIDIATVNTCNKSNVNQINVESFVQSSSSVSISNVFKSVQLDEILDHFCQTGPIKSIYISKKKRSRNTTVVYITYKKTPDALQCIKLFDGSQFQGFRIQVKLSLSKSTYLSLIKKFQNITISEDKSDRANLKLEENSAMNLVTGPKYDIENYKQTVYFKNLSNLCDSRFLTNFCAMNSIQTTGIVVDMVNLENRTHAGYVCCGTKQDSEKLFALLNNLNVGKCPVQCSWKLNVSRKYIYKDEQLQY